MIPPKSEFAVSSQPLVEQLLALLKGVPEGEAEQCLREALRGLQPSAGAHFAVDEGRAEIEALVRREATLPFRSREGTSSVTVARPVAAEDAADEVILGSDVGTGLGSDPLRRALFQLFKDVPAHKLRAIELWLCLQAQARAEVRSEVKVETVPPVRPAALGATPPSLPRWTGTTPPPDAIPENWAKAFSRQQRKSRLFNVVTLVGAACLGGAFVWMYSAPQASAGLTQRPPALEQVVTAPPSAPTARPPLPSVETASTGRGGLDTSTRHSALAGDDVEAAPPALASGQSLKAAAQPSQGDTAAPRGTEVPPLEPLVAPSSRASGPGAVTTRPATSSSAERVVPAPASQGAPKPVIPAVEAGPPRSESDDVFGSRE